jgi:rhamnogalacturonan endolyase
MRASLIYLTALVATSSAFLVANESSKVLILENNRLYAQVNKSIGAIDKLTLDGQDLLGSFNNIPNTPGGSSGNGNYGKHLSL